MYPGSQCRLSNETRKKRVAFMDYTITFPLENMLRNEYNDLESRPMETAINRMGGAKDEDIGDSDSYI